MNPYPAPLSFQPYDFSPPCPPGSWSVASTFPYQHRIPAPQVQHSILHQSHAITDPSLTINGIPSSKQQDAIAILQQFSNATISAWLTDFPSFLPSEQFFTPSRLSPQQCQALSALKDCPIDLVLTWLNFARSPNTLNVSQNLPGNSNLSNDRVAVNSLGQSPSSFSDPSIDITPRSPWDQESYNLSSGASVGELSSPAATSNDHVHWCFKHDNPRAIDKCDGFKKHMREHEKRFYCMLLGPVVRTDNGPKCAFCGILNPDIIHLSTHNVEPCASKPLAARSYSRKSLLINHLKKHGVTSVTDGSGLADRWRDTADKKYFACGFCVSCFDSLTEQSNHVDAVHFRFSEGPSDWDFNKVIRGLLSQSEVNEHWRSALAAMPQVQESLFTWNPALAKKLQHRLEMGQEPADVLCRAAIDESNYSRSGHGNVGSLPVTGLTGLNMDTSRSMQTFQRQDVWPTLPSNSNEDSTAHTHALTMTTPTLQSQQLPWSGFNLNNSNWYGIYGSQPVPQIVSETYGSPTSATRHRSDHPMQPFFSPTSAESLMPWQPPAYEPSIASASDTVQAWKGQTESSHSSRLGDYSQGVSPNFATNPRSRQVIEARRYPAQAHMDRFHPPFATQFAPSPLSRNRPTSSLGQLTSAYSPTNHSNLAARPRGQELRDVDVGFNTQHIIHDQDHTRRHTRPQ